MNAPQELGRLYPGLTAALGRWRRKSAVEIGAEQFRACERSLYAASDALDEYLASAAAKDLTNSARRAAVRLNKTLNKTALQLRALANSVQTYRPPRAGERRNDFKDQDAMNGRLDEITTSIKQIIKEAQVNARTLSRPPGGSGNRCASPNDLDYYWPDSRAAGSEHFR